MTSLRVPSKSSHRRQDQSDGRVLPSRGARIMRAAIIGGVNLRIHNSPLTNLENSNNQDSNATPTRPRPSRPPLRPPLQSRDSNAMMRVPPNAPLAKSGNAMPSYDKNNGTSRPLMPVLSAAAKASNRAPLTPRVAGSAPPTVSPSLSRRGARSENTTPATASKEDLSTPVSAFLNNNITPRSGPRKTRVDSTNTTPTGTPTGAPVPPSPETFRVAHEPPVYGSGLGINGIDKDVPKRATVSFSPAVSDIGYSKSPAQSNTGDSKFFFASEAKTVQPVRPVLQSKASASFVYANGETIPPPQSSGGSAVGSTVENDRAPKFFRANGTPDFEAPPQFHPPRPSSVVSNSSRLASPRLANPPGAFSPPQRPSSPSKLHQQASLASLRNPTLESPILPRPQVGGRGHTTTGIVAARRASIEVGRGSHGRSASVGSQDGIKAPPVRKISGGSETPASPLNIITTSVPVSTPEEIVEGEKDESGLQSPIKTGHSIDQLNELAANARRERKVLDLEITNSSLAAINRTLEREMRKQTAELRRYRRLSRSGRLSIATSASMRTSGALSALEGEDGTPLSDMSEEEESESEEDSDFSSDSDSASLSPRAMAESDARHRKRDEKRLQLDLTKHQQLLIDSQKMNQSLKRCLGWTEELINEGRKALEYHVRVSDVELGGRVLAPDEVEGEDIGEAESEGMSGIGARLLREARRAAKGGVSRIAGWGGEGRDDRDSGIEVDGSVSALGSGSQPVDSLPTSPR